jgi:hypothetical protein
VCNLPRLMCGLYLATASAKTKERSKAKHQWRSRDLEAAILTLAMVTKEPEELEAVVLH